tara:strand:- start:343 stop:624 length:282 start_codon:yes stop_codon:yes gene_type:complete
MKLDIKSFIIGILTVLNLFILMGFDDSEEEVGKYQFEILQGGQPIRNERVIVMDTSTGEFVRNITPLEARNEANPPQGKESKGNRWNKSYYDN